MFRAALIAAIVTAHVAGSIVDDVHAQGGNSAVSIKQACVLVERYHFCNAVAGAAFGASFKADLHDHSSEWTGRTWCKPHKADMAREVERIRRSINVQPKHYADCVEAKGFVSRGDYLRAFIK